jgi:hypothetical protein
MSREDRNFLKKLALSSIKWYQKNISSTKPPTCRYVPTCSTYTYTAIERFGLVKGGFMGLKRILRCNPFVKGGYDPVPEKIERRNKK